MVAKENCQIRAKLEAIGADELSIASAQRAYQSLLDGQITQISEADLGIMPQLPLMDQVVTSQTGSAYLDECVSIKLNGGLGTGMGLQHAKSLLPVKGKKCFLDFMMAQNRYVKEVSGVQVPGIIMNSPMTSPATMDYLQQHVHEAQWQELVQSRVPKIDQDTLQPIDWSAQSELEWCPPGHGDLYAALYSSGLLEQLIAQGKKYAFISNSDNTGAYLNPGLVRYFVESGLPFMLEVTRRTGADYKGGHLAIRNSDGQFILREIAQCAPEDQMSFQDIERHQYFNTNNIWVRLDQLQSLLEQHNGLLPLPIIANQKTVDPRNPTSPAVYQLESAVGAAIECFPGAGAICVPRRRFAPVKTTSDLLALRSDAYHITKHGRMMLVPERQGRPPVVQLCDQYRVVEHIEALGVPSLKYADALTITGPTQFESGTVIKGTVHIENPTSEVMVIPAGVYEDVEISF